MIVERSVRLTSHGRVEGEPFVLDENFIRLQSGLTDGEDGRVGLEDEGAGLGMNVGVDISLRSRVEDNALLN